MLPRLKKYCTGSKTSIRSGVAARDLKELPAGSAKGLELEDDLVVRIIGRLSSLS